jgi:KDO2-lipid IV(A) lauroyltransferase
MYKLLKYRVKVVRSNIELAFPELSPIKRLIIESDFYRHFCDIMLESMKASSMSKKQFAKRYKLINGDLVFNLLKKEKGVILLMAHFSNFEWTMSLGNYITGNKLVGIYTPLTNKYFERFYSKIRQKHKGYLLSRYKAQDFIKSEHENGNVNVYGFNSDQSPKPTEKTYWTNYLNVNVPFFTGGERIANKYNYPVVFASAKRIKRGYYSFEIFPVIKENSNPYNITDQFIEFVQNKIKESPSEYLWTHNRFKYKDLYDKFNSGN